jgi:hypothetical protein
LVQEGGVDYADYGAVSHDEADGDAVKGGEVGEVYGSWELVALEVGSRKGVCWVERRLTIEGIDAYNAT